MPFQDYGYKPSGITRPRARPTPKATSSSYYSGNEFGSGNIFTETSPGASTVNFGNNNNNDNDNDSYQAPSLVEAPTPTVTATAAPTPAQIEAERQDRIARVFEATGATLPEDKGRMGRVGRGIDLYSRDIFTTPFVATPDNTQEITDYLQRTAVDDALRDALGMPEEYPGMLTQEEPEPNVDMSVLQEAMMPEPITVEKLEVKAGDTLSSIAAENNLPVQDVIDANPQIKNPNMIRPGEMVSMPEAWQIASDGRAELIMKGVEKLFGLFPPKSAAEKKAKSELQYFLDAGQKLADSSDGYPSWFKYIPDRIQLADYIVDKMNRNLESTIRETAEIDAAKRDAAGITRSLTPEEVAERNKARGTMNFTDGDVDMSNLQFVDIEDEQPEGLMSRRFDSKGATGLTTFYEDIGKKAESDHGSTPVPTKDARETKEYIDGKLNPNYIANPEDRSKDVGYGHKVTAAEEASGKIRGVTFKNEDGTYKDLTEEDKVTILNADMQAHTKAARDAGWDTKLANIGTSWNQLDPSYQRALTSLAYNVGGRKAGEQWTAVLRAAKDRDVTEFARHLRRQDAGRYTAGMDNRVMKELKFAGLIDKRRDVSSVLPLADRRSGIAN